MKRIAILFSWMLPTAISASSDNRILLTQKILLTLILICFNREQFSITYFFHLIANSNKTIRYKFLENKWTLFHISETVCVIFREINWKLANLSLQIEADLHFFKTVKERWHFLFFEFITAVQSFSIKSNISNIFVLIVPNLYYKIECST